MNKDLSLLKEVSVYFTEESLKKIVATEKNVDPRDVEISGWDFGEAGAKGGSYLSVVSRVRIESKINGKVGETNVVIKALPKNRARRDSLRSTQFFRNEIVFYTEIAAKFKEYLKSKGQSQLLRIPDCYDSLLDGENDYIVLEDVSVKGFGPVVRQNILSYEQCKYIAESLARFHAISFGFKNEKKEEFDKMVDLLMETYFTDELYESWYKRFHEVLVDVAKDSLAKEYPSSKAEKVFNTYTTGALVKKSNELCARRHEPTSAVSQGDAWAPNFLVRELGSGRMDALMLDFQLARCASPTIDLVFFIYACTDEPMRAEYYERILKDYYDELAKSMRLLGVEPEKVYSWQVFRKEVKENSVVGLTFALEAVPVTMMPEEEAFDLDRLTEVTDPSEIFVVSKIESSENRKRHAGIIVHAVEHGFI